MQIYFVILLMGIVFLLYAVIGFMLYKRSKERNIKSRSPVLLHITHWANYLEISLAIINIFPQYGIDLWNFQELSLFQSLGLIAHYLVFFPYILRCYRLYFVFHLDKDWAIQNNSFKRHINRTKQRWLVKMLTFCMIPVMLATVFLWWEETAIYFPLNSPYTKYESIPHLIYNFVCFAEQLTLIIGIYKIKDISDDYNMSKELAVIGCIWFVNPAFSLNLGDNQALATIPYVVRNLLLMLRSSLVPIIYSYKNKPLFQPLTSDLLNSLELILQNAVTLEAFEEFLRLEELTTTLSFGSGLNTGSGLTMLEFYLKCRLHADKGDRVWAESIFSDYLETKNIQVPADIYLDIENGDFLDLNLFNKAEDHVINMLKTYYYPKFVVSDQYIFLRRLIHRQEIYTYRLMQTSMHEYQANNNKKVNIDCDDWHTQSLD